LSYCNKEQQVVLLELLVPFEEVEFDHESHPENTPPEFALKSAI